MSKSTNFKALFTVPWLVEVLPVPFAALKYVQTPASRLNLFSNSPLFRTINDMSTAFLH